MKSSAEKMLQRVVNYVLEAFEILSEAILSICC